jgi:hypothetical protein
MGLARLVSTTPVAALFMGMQPRVLRDRRGVEDEAHPRATSSPREHHHHHHRKGTTVKSTVRNARSAPTLKMGLFALFATVTLALALSVGTAQAAVEHSEIGEFSGAETPAKSFGSASGAAVDASTGDVYVADITNNVVDKFTAAGKYICQMTGEGENNLALPLSECASVNKVANPGTPSESFAFFEPTALAVDNSTDPSDPAKGDLYVLDPGHGVVDVFNAAGGYVGQVGGSTPGTLYGVSVDASGDVWIYGAEGEVREGDVREFSPTGSPISEFHNGILVEPAFAVDSNTSVYAQREFGVEKFSTTGQKFGMVDECRGSCQSVAVDLATDDVYVDAGSRVEELDSSSAPLATFGQTQLASAGAGGIAVNPSTGTVYVANAGDGEVFIYGRTPGPRVLPGPASGVGASDATISATINPESSATTYQFEYGTSTSYGQTTPVAPAGAGSILVAANTSLTELESGTTYHYRVVATDASGNTTRGADLTFTTLPQPVLRDESATNLARNSAVLNARVDPEGLQLEDCHFDYGTSTSYGLSVPCSPAAATIPPDSSEHVVSASIAELHENTTYHWRVVATNANGTSTSSDHTFVYDTSGGGLPDGRAYEMVSPPQKNGSLLGDTFVFGLLPDIAEDGSRLILETIQCFADAGSCTAIRGGQIGSPYAFTRTSDNWSVSALAPPATDFAGNTIFAYSAQAGTALVSATTPPSGEDDFYARQEDGSLTDIGPVTPPSDGPSSPSDLGTVHSVYATADFSHLAWEQHVVEEEHPWPSLDSTIFTSVGINTAYEYVGADNTQPVLVGVSGGEGSTDLISRCGTELSSKVRGDMSEDGRMVYFTADACPSPFGGSGTGGSGVNAGVPVSANALYARIDNGEADAHTVAISQRSPTECTTAECLGSPPSNAQLQGISVDGSKAFFTSQQQLIDGATNGQDNHNLYLYDFNNPAGHNLVDVSAGDTSGGGSRVKGVVAISSDGSHIYFVAGGVLTAATNGDGQVAQAGANNLYVYADGRVAFIAALPGSDALDWGNASETSANVTPDGRFLVFPSHGRLTPDDTSVGGALQIFRYDAQSGELLRISIGNDGFDDNGNRSVPTPCAGGFCPEDARLASVDQSTYLAGPARRDPTMSHDGEYVFFQSPVALTPQAINDFQLTAATENSDEVPTLAQNVYEWHAGHVSLISDGRDVSTDGGQDATCVDNGQGEEEHQSSVCLFGTDATGTNVFFSTADPLVEQDTDTELDLYDARICTAESQCIKQAPPALPPCLGEACHGTPAGTPLLPNVPSVTFDGQGNITPVPVAKPKAKALTRAQKLADALKGCRKDKKKSKRVACEKQARSKYGPTKRQAKAKKSSNDRRTSR